MTADGTRRVLVIGGTSQIGRAIVERLCRSGDRVVFNGRNTKRGKALAETTGAQFIACDVNAHRAPERVIAETLEMIHGLDGLVLGAGLLHTARISETTDAAWDQVLETNLIAPFRIAKAAMPALAEGGGSIVTIASGTAARTEFELGAYSAAKRAVLWLTNMLAVEGGPSGVIANTVCPGDLRAGMRSIADAPQLRNLGPAPLPPTGRPVAADDVARAVDFFLCKGASSVSGAALTVDGAMRSALRAGKVHQP